MVVVLLNIGEPLVLIILQNRTSSVFGILGSATFDPYNLKSPAGSPPHSAQVSYVRTVLIPGSHRRAGRGKLWRGQRSFFADFNRGRRGLQASKAFSAIHRTLSVTNSFSRTSHLFSELFLVVFDTTDAHAFIDALRRGIRLLEAKEDRRRGMFSHKLKSRDQFPIATSLTLKVRAIMSHHITNCP